jgi:LysR family transcriptional regulator, glycine cleavage system transcriptional activator
MRNAPSMTGLRALEAVLRHGALSAAARELCVTPAAVSHRLRDLESRCGAPLVHRVGGRFVATETGRAISEALGDAFQRIRFADDLLHRRETRELKIAASYSFAIMWLMPRIALLEQRFPDVDLNINPTHAPLSDGPSDVTIVHAARPPERTGWTRLFEDRCAAMARADHPFFTTDQRQLQDVLQFRLVHIAHDRGPQWGEYSWQDWAAGHGIAWPDTRRKGSSVSAEHVAADMLLTSDGFALISVINASGMLESGLLRAVHRSEAPSGCSYWISSRGETGQGAALSKRFVDWMIGMLGA